MKETGFGFDFINHIKDPEFHKHFLNKLNRIEEKIFSRKGPHLRWLEENEPYDKVVMPTPGFKEGIPTIDRILNDFESGFALIAGESNAGKSSLLIQLIRDVLNLQDDTIVLDLSLDDSSSKRYVQMISNISGMPYQWVYNIKSMGESVQESYLYARSVIDDWIKQGRYIPLESSEEFNSVGGKSIDVILNNGDVLVNLIYSYRELFPDKKIVLFLDSISDMDYDMEAYGKLDKSLQDLKRVLNDAEVKLLATCHVRKVESRKRHLTINDLKGSKEFEYSASMVGLLENDSVSPDPDNPLTINRDGIDYPVISLFPSKSKVSGWSRIPWFAGIDIGCCRIIPINKKEYMHLSSGYDSKFNS